MEYLKENKHDGGTSHISLTQRDEEIKKHVQTIGESGTVFDLEEFVSTLTAEEVGEFYILLTRKAYYLAQISGDKTRLPSSLKIGEAPTILRNVFDSPLLANVDPDEKRGALEKATHTLRGRIENALSVYTTIQEIDSAKKLRETFISINDAYRYPHLNATDKDALGTLLLIKKILYVKHLLSLNEASENADQMKSNEKEIENLIREKPCLSSALQGMILDISKEPPKKVSEQEAPLPLNKVFSSTPASSKTYDTYLQQLEEIDTALHHFKISSLPENAEERETREKIASLLESVLRGTVNSVSETPSKKELAVFSKVREIIEKYKEMLGGGRLDSLRILLKDAGNYDTASYKFS